MTFSLTIAHSSIICVRKSSRITFTVLPSINSIFRHIKVSDLKKCCSRNKKLDQIAYWLYYKLENFGKFDGQFHEKNRQIECYNSTPTVWKLREFSLTHFWQKIRESNVFTKEITRELI